MVDEWLYRYLLKKMNEDLVHKLGVSFGLYRETSKNKEFMKNLRCTFIYTYYRNIPIRDYVRRAEKMRYEALLIENIMNNNKLNG